MYYESKLFQKGWPTTITLIIIIITTGHSLIKSYKGSMVDIIYQNSLH